MSSTLLRKLEAVIATDLDRRQKAKLIAETLRTVGSYRWVGIYDVDTRKGLVSNIAWAGPSAPAYPEFPVTKGLTSRAIAERRTVNVGNVAEDSDYLVALDTTKSEIIIPILESNAARVVGTLDVESERANAFDSATQELLESCASALSRFLTQRR